MCNYVEDCPTQTTVLLFMMLPALPICWLETYTALSYFSVTSIASALIGILCFIEFCIVKFADGTSVHGEVNYFNFLGMIGHIGVAMFVFEGNAVIITVRDEAKDKEKFPKLLIASIIFNLVIFMVFGFIAYFTFLDQS